MIDPKKWPALWLRRDGDGLDDRAEAADEFERRYLYRWATLSENEKVAYYDAELRQLIRDKQAEVLDQVASDFERPGLSTVGTGGAAVGKFLAQEFRRRATALRKGRDDG